MSKLDGDSRRDLRVDLNTNRQETQPSVQSSLGSLGTPPSVPKITTDLCKLAIVDTNNIGQEPLKGSGGGFLNRDQWSMLDLLTLREESRGSNLIDRAKLAAILPGKVLVEATNTGQYSSIRPSKSQPGYGAFINNQYSGVVFTSLDFNLPKEWIGATKPINLSIILSSQPSPLNTKNPHGLFTVGLIQPNSSTPEIAKLNFIDPSNIQELLVSTNNKKTETVVDVVINQWPSDFEEQMQRFNRIVSVSLTNVSTNFLLGSAQDGLTFTLPNAIVHIRS
jgi:hypothetical protein